VNKRIAPEKKSDIQYVNYPDPETLFKLEAALQDKGKTTENNESLSVEMPSNASRRKSVDIDKRKETKNSSEPPLRKTRNRKLVPHEQNIKMNDPEEEFRTRGIMRIYGNRSKSPELRPINIRQINTRKPRSKINLREENITGMSYLPGELARVSKSVANTPFEINQDISDKGNKIKREENRIQNNSYLPRTQFMTKISSQFSKQESQERPTENENENSNSTADAYIALLKVQEKIDISYALLREKIIKSRGDNTNTPRGKSPDRERPNTVASLNLINVKNITNGILLRDGESSNGRKISTKGYEKKPSIRRTGSEEVKDYESVDGNKSNKSIVKTSKKVDFANKSTDIKENQIHNLSLNFDELNTTKDPYRKKLLELNQEINKHDSTDRLSTPEIERRIIHENLHLDNTSMSMGINTPHTDWRGSPENKNNLLSPSTEANTQVKGFKKINVGTPVIPSSINENILKGVNIPVRKVSFSKAAKPSQEEKEDDSLLVNTRERNRSVFKRE